ncbi:hypothetical protein ACMFMG_011980 [Clarireedia jacksonii]
MSAQYICKSIESLAEESGEAAFIREMEYLLKEKQKLEKSMIRLIGHSGMSDCRMKVFSVADMEVQDRQLCTGWKPIVNVLKEGRKVRWHLPVEVWCMIFDELSLYDLKRVRSKSRKMRELVGPMDAAKMSDAQYSRYVKGRMRDVALSRAQQVEEKRCYNKCIRVFKGLYKRERKRVEDRASQDRQPDREDYEIVSGGSVTVNTAELLEECYLQAVWLRSPVGSVFVSGCSCIYCVGQIIHRLRSFTGESPMGTEGGVGDDDEEYNSTR